MHLVRRCYQRAARALTGTGLSARFPFRALNERLVARLRQDTVVIHGHTLHLDPADSLGLSTAGFFEPFETEFFRRHIRPGQIALDIGANIGYYTLLFAKLVGPGGTVYAFEPDPANFALLEQNIASNGYTNIVAERLAAADIDGHARLYRSRTGSSDHRLFDCGDGRSFAGVETARLDTRFGPQPRRIDWIKMDIQGAECAALEGMEGLVKANPALTLVTEFWPAGLSQGGVSGAQFLSRLRDFGLLWRELDERGRRIRPATEEELLARYTPANGRHTNLICSRDVVRYG